MKNIAIIILSLIASSCSWLHPRIKSGLEGRELPNFQLLKDSSTAFNTSLISTGKPFVLFLYGPDCHYCNEEMNDILTNMKDFSKLDFYLITSDSLTSIKRFSAAHNLKNYSNFIFIRDTAMLLLNYFSAPGVPYLAFYDNKKKLTDVSIGKTEISTIKDMAIK